MIRLKPLIDKFGKDKTRLYLRKRFAEKTPEAFWEFAYLVFGVKMPDKSPDFHETIISDLIKNGTVDCGRNAFAAPRGGAKSTLTGTMYATWLCVNGFLKSIVYASDTYKKAIKLSSPIRKEIEGNKILRWLYPEAKSKEWGKEGFLVHGICGDTYMMPVGSGMNVRGISENNARPELVLLDDLENLEMVYSSDQRKKLKDWLDFDVEPAMDRYHRNIVYVGTLLHYHSLLNQVLSNEGKYKSWNTRLFKALDEHGKSFWEDRFSADYLREIRDNPEHPDFVGSIVFAQEYQNEPQDDKDRVIKADWLKTYNYREQWVKLEADSDQKREERWLKTLEITGGVDPAISESEKADEFTFYTYGYDPVTKNEYMLDLIILKTSDPAEQVRAIADGIEKWKHSIVGVEAVQYQKGLQKLVQSELQHRRIYGVTIRAIKTDKDKIRRARIHSVAFEAGFVRLRTDHPNFEKLRDQIMEFPLAEHDDRFDGLMLAREARQKPKARAFAKKPEGF
jgi:predicted phage terminase large subunit-like protein